MGSLSEKKTWQFVLFFTFVLQSYLFCFILYYIMIKRKYQFGAQRGKNFVDLLSYSGKYINKRFEIMKQNLSLNLNYLFYVVKCGAQRFFFIFFLLLLWKNLQREIITLVPQSFWLIFNCFEMPKHSAQIFSLFSILNRFLRDFDIRYGFKYSESLFSRICIKTLILTINIWTDYLWV